MNKEIILGSLNSELYGRQLTAITLAGLALVGCSNDSSKEQPSPNPEVSTGVFVEPSPIEEPTQEWLPAGECSFRYVQLGLNFNEANRMDLAADLAVITKLEQGTGAVQLRDILTASRIIKDSYQDPLYAQAMTEARLRLAEPGETVTVEDFLSTPVTPPRQCDPNHIEKSASKNQLHQTATLSQAITRQLGERLGKNASRVSREAYETFQRQMERLREQVEQDELQTS